MADYTPAATKSQGVKHNLTKHRSKFIKPKLSVQFCTKGLKHKCFRLQDYGWFVIIDIPNTRRNKFGPKFQINSVQNVNTAEAVSKYVYINIMSRETINCLLTNFIEHIKNNPDSDYHSINE